MMLAAKNMDPVIGVDIHLIKTPGPPVPIPHPFVGMLFDWFDYVPKVGGTVFINNAPRALAGTAAKARPKHIPIGSFFMPNIRHEGEQFMGSKTVKMDGEVVAYNTLPVITCNDIGMPAPFRANPKKKSKTKSLLLPSSMVLTIPIGVPVFIGGPPTVSGFAMVTKFGMMGLGKGLKKLANSKSMQKAMSKVKALKAKAFKNMKPGFLKCKVLRAEPVNIVTGEVVVEQEDFSLPWRIPMDWTRRYSSQSKRIGACGYGWETPADARLEIDEMGIVTFFDGTPGASVFESLPKNESIMELVDGAILSKTDTGHMVTTKSGLMYCFGDFTPRSREVLVDQVLNRCANEVKYIRNERGVLQEIQESSGIRILIRNKLDRIEEMILIHPIEDNNPRLLMRYEYEGNHQLVRVFDALMNPYQFAYAQNKMLRHTDRNGLSFYYQYDGAKQDAKCIRAWGDGGLYEYTFTYLENETQFVDSLGGEWKVIYENGLIIQEVDAIGRDTFFGYDESGRTISVLKATSELERKFNYDDKGNLIELIQEDSTSILYEFNSKNTLEKFTDPNGNDWRQNWNADFSLQETTSPRGTKWLYKHDGKGDLVEIIAPNDLVTSLEYNTHGNLIRVFHQLDFEEKFSYNALGQVILKSDKNDHEFSYDFDKKGRLIFAKMPDGNSVTYSYDKEDNIIYVKDGNDAETKLKYFGQGEVAEIMRSDGTKIQFIYDTEERLTKVINERNQQYKFNLDLAGRVIGEVDYWGNKQHYIYDVADNVIEFINSENNFIKANYDRLGQLLSKIDCDKKETKFKYDKLGHIIFASNPLSKITRKYDEEGNLIEEIQNDIKITNEYDLLGNRTKRNTSYGNEVEFSFDQIGRVNAINYNTENIARMDYDGGRLMSKEFLSNNIQREIFYDTAGRIKKQSTSKGKNILVERNYAYDKVGNLKTRNSNKGESSFFEYDSRGRLIGGGDNSAPAEKIIFNAFGSLPIEEQLDTGNRIESFKDNTYLYNKKGNLILRKTSEGEAAFSWDMDNRLVAAKNEKGQKIEFGYDPFGRRIFKDVDGHKKYFAWDGDQLLNEKTNEGGIGEFIYRPDTFVPFALANRNISYYENDSIGLPHEIISEDGVKSWSANFTHTGNRKKVSNISVVNNIHFQGQYFDEELQLCYNRNRYFDSKTGRFISKDPLGLGTGSDLYVYAPNIWGWVDPLGLSCYPVLTVKKGDYISRKGDKDHIYDNIRAYMKKKGIKRMLFYRVGESTKNMNRVSAKRVTGGAKAGYQRSWDEFPFASSNKGGIGARIANVPKKQNDRQGAIIGNFYRKNNIEVGDKYWIKLE